MRTMRILAEEIAKNIVSERKRTPVSIYFVLIDKDFVSMLKLPLHTQVSHRNFIELWREYESIYYTWEYPK